jgi:hypothetical protein
VRSIWSDEIEELSRLRLEELRRLAPLLAGLEQPPGDARPR